MSRLREQARKMRKPAIPYGAQERAWLEAHCTMHRPTMAAQFNAKFGRNVALKNLNAMCKRNGWLTGRTGHYTKNQAAWNKGKKMPFNANSAKTQFKKGHAPSNRKPIGHERMGKDGYILVKTDAVNPHTGFNGFWEPKHKFLWEQENGAVPPGMVLKSIDGDRLNTSPDNWRLIPISMLGQLSGRGGRDYDNAPADLKPIIFTTAQLADRLTKATS